MNLNDFKSELEGYLGKLSGLMPVGHPWWGFDPKSKPAGVQLFAGQELSREAYPKHWELVNGGKRTVVTEEEWQEMVANQGFCQFYSSGDGSTTYRMPLVKDVHPKFVAALAEAGQYLEAGLPDITGTFAAFPVTTSGAIYLDINQPTGDRGAGAGSSVRHIFQASRYNPIYGNSDTVQPEALTLLVGEYVISSVATLSTSESENILASITTLESSKLDKTGGGITGNLSVSGDVFVGGTINASISGTSENAVKASQDAQGNVIDETYATKSEISGVVRTVNGVGADAAGNVDIARDDFVPVSTNGQSLGTSWANGSIITAPESGWIRAVANTTAANGKVELWGPAAVCRDESAVKSRAISCTIPIGKGDKITFWYEGVSLSTVYFYYCKGTI